MSTPIPCLDLLILGAALAPSGFSSALCSIARPAPRGDINAFTLLVTTGIYPVIISAAILVRPELGFFHWPKVVFYLLALLAAPVGLALEYLLQGLFIYLRTGKRARGLTLHASLGTKLPLSYVLNLTLIPIGQELVYRQIWFVLLAQAFHFPPAAVILISALSFGLDHLFWGLGTVALKSLTGALYGCLYFFSGSAIIVPILAHILQNWLLLLLARRKNA